MALGTVQRRTALSMTALTVGHRWHLRMGEPGGNVPVTIGACDFGSSVALMGESFIVTGARGDGGGVFRIGVADAAMLGFVDLVMAGGADVVIGDDSCAWRSSLNAGVAIGAGDANFRDVVGVVKFYFITDGGNAAGEDEGD